MKKTTIKLNEMQLKQVISNVINEMFGDSSLGPNAQGPSQEEEEFEYELYGLIDQYKDWFLSHGYSQEEFCKWCCEIVEKACK